MKNRILEVNKKLAGAKYTVKSFGKIFRIINRETGQPLKREFTSKISANNYIKNTLASGGVGLVGMRVHKSLTGAGGSVKEWLEEASSGSNAIAIKQLKININLLKKHGCNDPKLRKILQDSEELVKKLSEKS